MDYQIQTNTRKCAATGRELRPGERVFTVLLDREGKFVREDFCAEAWQGPPTEAFSHWASRVPEPNAKKRLVVDDDLLMDCFQRLEGQAEASKVNFRFVVGLLLMRRRRLRLEESRSDAGQDLLCFRCARTGDRHEVVQPPLNEAEIAAVQAEVFQVLGWE